MENIEDIKVGDKYELELLCIHNGGKVVIFETPTGDHLPFRERDIECVSPAAHKYDPCRKFKKGDKVRAIRRDGRIGSPSIKIGAIAIVEESEDDDNLVVLRNPSPKRQPFICIRSYFLELVTPVGELEPYSVGESDAFDIVREGKIVMTIPFTEDDYYTFEQAKAAAEAECKRLNEEYRKEQK